jgi:hypothetical protein
MNFLRLIVIAIFSLIGFTIFGILNEQKFLISLGHIFSLPLVGIWYGIKRNWSTESTDYFVYFAFLLGSLADSVIIIDWGQKGEFLSISISLIMNLLLIMIFRKEGTRIYSENLQDLPKVLIPVLIIFLFFGYILMPSVPSSIYVVSIFYAILEVLLVIHGFFRTVRGRSYQWVISGIFLVVLKDAIYSFHFFIFNGTKTYLYAIQYPLNILSYFMVAIGIAINQENLKKSSLFQQIKKRINVILNFINSFDNKTISSPSKKMFELKRLNTCQE